MTRREAAAMLSMAGVELVPADLAALLRHTEGWPAALYLAALSLRGRQDPHRAVAGFAGDDRLVADYLRDEVLTQLPASSASFLIRTSILGRLSGPICDAVLGSAGSGAVLRDLERSGIPLVPLDAADSEYRHHALLGEMLRAELRRREPARSAELHRRAGAWHEHEGDVAPALEHAIEAGDVRRRRALPVDDRGGARGRRRARGGTAWLERFRPEQLSARSRRSRSRRDGAPRRRRPRPHRALGAHRRSGCSRPTRTRRRAAEAAVIALRALVGARRAGGDGQRRRASLTSSHPTTARGGRCARCCAAPGCTCSATGRARGIRSRRAPAAAAIVAPIAQVLCLSQLALIAIDESDWEQAALLSSRARSQVERSPLADYPASALVYAVSALVRAHRERVEAAQADRQQALTLLVELVDGPPWYELETRVALARATLRLGDVVGTRTLLAEARRLLPEIADSAPAAAWIEDCDAQAAVFAVASLDGPAALTTAELRVLRMLPTHLSFREMGMRLQVSSNTIKTHAHAVYRKLDACSRSEAVVRARRMGLVDA